MKKIAISVLSITFLTIFMSSSFLANKRDVNEIVKEEPSSCSLPAIATIPLTEIEFLRDLIVRALDDIVQMLQEAIVTQGEKETTCSDNPIALEEILPAIKRVAKDLTGQVSVLRKIWASLAGKKGFNLELAGRLKELQLLLLTYEYKYSGGASLLIDKTKWEKLLAFISYYDQLCIESSNKKYVARSFQEVCGFLGSSVKSWMKDGAGKILKKTANAALILSICGLVNMYYVSGVSYKSFAYPFARIWALVSSLFPSAMKTGTWTDQWWNRLTSGNVDGALLLLLLWNYS